MKYLVLVLLLTACAPYQPNLATPPKNVAKYEADKKECIIAGRKEVDRVAANLKGSWFKTPSDFADDCMTAKGYAVIPR